jgi:DNA ligase-4
MLRKFVKPLKGRVEILVPAGGLNIHRTPGSLDNLYAWDVH